MMTPEEYIASLRELKTVVFWRGKRIENWVDHPAIRPHIDSAALTYDIGCGDVPDDVRTAVSHLTGKRVNRFTHIHQNPDDLLKKVTALRGIAQKTGSCFQRCVGWDALNALYGVTYEIDLARGTSYQGRLVDFLLHIQKTDRMCDGAMTDSKGDRGLPPSKQPDPDQFVHVIERRPDGIVVRGAKAHQTGAVNSHEIIVMPTVAMGPDDADYALSFAIPMDTPGIVCVFGRQANDTRKEEPWDLDRGNACFGAVGGEALVVFEDVFVPWERVFMCGEYEFAGLLVERFAAYHRQNYGGCKTGLADILIGACAALSEYQGTAKASHIREKLVEMTQLAETMYCCSVACSVQGKNNASGQCFVDPLLASVTKLNVARNVYDIARLAQEVAGGVIATLPSAEDFYDADTGKYVEKYFKGVEGVPTATRIRMARLIEALSSGTALVESMHGAGSPQALKVAIQRQMGLDKKMRLATDLAGVTESAETAAAKARTAGTRPVARDG